MARRCFLFLQNYLQRSDFFRGLSRSVFCESIPGSIQALNRFWKRPTKNIQVAHRRLDRRRTPAASSPSTLVSLLHLKATPCVPATWSASPTGGIVLRRSGGVPRTIFHHGIISCIPLIAAATTAVRYDRQRLIFTLLPLSIETKVSTATTIAVWFLREVQKI